MIARVLLSVLIAAPAYAGQQPDAFAGGSIMRMVGSLLAVLGLIYLAYAFLPKWNKLLSKMALKSGKRIQVLESTAIAPKRNLCLVRIGNETMLLGVTAQSISYLAAIDTDAGEFHETIAAQHEK